MSEALAKIERVQELVESGADKDVVERFVKETEEQFVNAAIADLQQGHYKQAACEYLHALLLPGRTQARGRLFESVLAAVGHSGLDVNELDQLECLKDVRFDDLKIELVDRLQQNKQHTVLQRFIQLDSERSLRAKNFAELKEVLAQLKTLKRPEDLVAELRLAREEKAQTIFNQIVERFVDIAKESGDLKVDAEIYELAKQAVEFSGGNPGYADEIREYIGNTEDLFAKARAAGVIEEIHNSSHKLRDHEFLEFAKLLRNYSEAPEVLGALVKASRILQEDPLVAEIHRMGVHWTKEEGRLRYRKMAADQPGETLRIVSESLEVIKDHIEVLPPEIAIDFFHFLQKLERELNPPKIPNAEPEIVMPPLPLQEKPGCLTAWLTAIKGWFVGRQPVKKSAMFLIGLFLLCSQTARAQSHIVLSVDVSDSMNDNDRQKFRYSGAAEFLTLLGLYKQDANKTGIVAVGNDARVIKGLSSISVGEATQYEKTLSDLPAEAWTELGKGLQTSMKVLGPASEASRGIVLLSDGIIEGDPKARGMGRDEARAAAEKELWEQIVPILKENRIKVYTVGLFDQDRRGEPLMKRLASETGGFYTHLTKPEEFSSIYRKMLDEIDRPSGVTAITETNKKFLLTPVDYGVIITGRKDFSVTSPSGEVYPSQDPNASSVRQQYIQYGDGNAILFLAEPAEKDKQRSGEWSGEWLVRMSGDGQATYLSHVRFLRKDNLPPRSQFFRNEYLQLGYVLDLNPKVDPETVAFLNQCKTRYTIVRTDASSGWTRSAEVQASNLKFSVEQLLDQEGDFLMEVQMFCGSIPYRKYPESFHVSNAEFLSLGISDAVERKALLGQSVDQDENIFVEGLLNSAEAAKQIPEYRGFKAEPLKLSFAYNGGKAEEADEATVNPAPDGTLVAERTVRKSGDLLITGDLAGELILKNPDGSDLLHYPVKFKSIRPLRVSHGIWAYVHAAWSWFMNPVLPLLGFALTLFFGLQGKQWWNMDSMSIISGAKGVNLDLNDSGLSIFQKAKRSFRRRGPYVSIGGPGSGADVVLSKAGGSAAIADIGKDIFDNFYIVATGDREIKVNSNLLERGVKTTIKPEDKIFIDGVGEGVFKPTKGD